MRAAIFIDGAYLQKQAQIAKVDLNFSRLADFFLSPVRKNVPVDLLRCYFYHCPPWMSAKPTEDELRRMKTYSDFAEILEGLDRWQLRLGKLERRRDGDRDYYEQKRVDVLLCDLTRHSAAGHIQHAILVAGDSDFIPAVIAAKESGVTLSLWCGLENTVHRDLLILADEVHHFNWPVIAKLGQQKTHSHRQNTPKNNIKRKTNPKKPVTSS